MLGTRVLRVRRGKSELADSLVLLVLLVRLVRLVLPDRPDILDHPVCPDPLDSLVQLVLPDRWDSLVNNMYFIYDECSIQPRAAHNARCMTRVTRRNAR